MLRSSLFVGLACSTGLSLVGGAAHAQTVVTQNFTTPTATGFTYLIPTGATRLDITARGAGGGTQELVNGGKTGGNGGLVSTSLLVGDGTPFAFGTALTVFVGGGGAAGSANVAGGINGGGSSGSSGGGGWSGVSFGTVRTYLLVAGGGGGGSVLITQLSSPRQVLSRRSVWGQWRRPRRAKWQP